MSSTTHTNIPFTYQGYTAEQLADSVNKLPWPVFLDTLSGLTGPRSQALAQWRRENNYEGVPDHTARELLSKLEASNDLTSSIRDAAMTNTAAADKATEVDETSGERKA